MKRTRYKLPDKLHELLDIALEDVGAMERDPRYLIHMEQVYHFPVSRMNAFDHGELMRMAEERGAQCVACAAGAVMVGRLGADIGMYRASGSYGLHNELRLDAIDRLREGDAGGAWNSIHDPSDPSCQRILTEVEKLDRDVKSYTHDPEDWWEAMMEFHMDLRKADV